MAIRAVSVVLMAALSGPVLVAACGSRTGLLGPLASEASAPDAAPDVLEEADVFEEPDADVVFPDGPDICPDAGSTLVYVITESNDLFSFYPPTLTFTRIGPVSCVVPGATPFSMAVDRRGIGLSVFSDGTLHQIDMGTAACRDTTFQPDQLGFQTFCMGYAANSGDGGDAGETLYVAECNVSTNGGAKPNSMGLATLDTTQLTLSYVAPFSQGIPGPELTGTGDGRLFGFYTNTDPATSGSHIVQIDRGTGALLQDYPLQVGTPLDGYAFAFWGGVFWVFTSNQGTIVTRFDPTTGSETNVTTMPEGVVGAGVSTCAPM